MDNVILVGILVLMIGAIVFYLVREKKKGVKCIGCPNAKTCSMAQRKKCNGMCDSENK